MRPYRIVAVFLSLVVLMIPACGNDDDDNADGNNNENNGVSTLEGSAKDIIGTWQLISVDGEAVPGEHTFTINDNGTWGSTSVTDIPGLGAFTVTSQGSYKIAGDRITGEVMEVKIEPNLGFPAPVESGFSEDESTVEVAGNRMTITSTDSDTGTTSVTIYEKK